MSADCMLSDMLALVLSTVLTAQLQETITVSRVLVDVRVTEWGGEPITGLTAEDFEVRIAGKRATVESLEWIEESPVESPVERRALSPPLHRNAGRLAVFFVQTDFARHPSRLEGQMKFLQYADELLKTFDEDDRMAVFSFDSHLKFRLDFTNDKNAVREALFDTLYIDHPGPPPAVDGPSLAPRIRREDMKRAAESERGIQLVAEALRELPGPKSMVLLGWGLGELTPMGVKMKHEWKAARTALDAARVTIFSLDTTVADYHDLEVGLQGAANDTGGFYAKTHVFPQIAINRLQRTLSGRYELELRAAQELKPGAYAVSVRVKRRGVLVLAPQTVIIER